MAVLCIIGCILAILWLARLTFTLLFFVPATICLSNETTTETCGNDVLSQDLKNEINTAGTLVEAGSSIFIILLIFFWEKFNVPNLFLAVPRLAVFWFWIGLFALQTLSIVNIDITPRKWAFLGVCLLLEYASLVLLSLALKFITKSTVKAWITETVASQHWAMYLYSLYILTLWMYLLRNLALVFHDMALLTKRIDRHATRKHIDNVLKLATIAFRSSFAQFFYAAIFRNPNLSTVCKEQNPLRDEIFPIAIGDTTDRQRMLTEWVPYIT